MELSLLINGQTHKTSIDVQKKPTNPQQVREWGQGITNQVLEFMIQHGLEKTGFSPDDLGLDGFIPYATEVIQSMEAGREISEETTRELRVRSYLNGGKLHKLTYLEDGISFGIGKESVNPTRLTITNYH